MRRHWLTLVGVFLLASRVAPAQGPVDRKAPGGPAGKLSGEGVTTDVVYGHKAGMALTFDIYRPERPNGAAVISILSGGWRSSWDTMKQFRELPSGSFQLLTAAEIDREREVGAAYEMRPPTAGRNLGAVRAMVRVVSSEVIMKRVSATWFVAALMSTVVTVVNHAAPQGAQTSASRGSNTPMVFDTVTKQKIRVVTVASGLMHPWSIAFLPDGHTMLVADRSGQLRVVRDGVLDPTPISGLPMSEPFKSVPTRPGMQGILPGPDRLNEVTLHPQFAQNHLVYLSYPKHGELGNTIAVARGRLEGMTLKDVRDILVADAWETSGNLGGKMLFGPDGTLYVTVGDRDRLCCVDYDDNSIRMKAQDLSNHIGKTLRVKDDGSVPPDNPFVGRAGAKPEIFTYGHRNGYGLAFHPETGALWQAEIGPMGGDELNILLPGRNYGWPLVSMGRNYTGTLVSDQPWSRPGMENPRVFWVPSISPSGLAFYTGDKLPTWKGSLFVGSLNGKQLQRLSFGQPGQAERRESLLTPLDVRIRDVRQGPDGNLYVATEKQASGEDLDGTVLRIEPAP